MDKLTKKSFSRLGHSLFKFNTLQCNVFLNAQHTGVSEETTQVDEVVDQFGLYFAPGEKSC